MMLLWACAGVPLGAYNISSNFNIALLIQPQILTVLSLITWGQCFYYDDVCFLRPHGGAFFNWKRRTLDFSPKIWTDKEKEMERDEVL